MPDTPMTDAQRSEAKLLASTIIGASELAAGMSRGLATADNCTRLRYIANRLKELAEDAGNLIPKDADHS